MHPYIRKKTMCPWEELSPLEEWAIEMTAPGLDLLSKMQTEFEESEEGKLDQEGCLAWAEDAHELVGEQVVQIVEEVVEEEPDLVVEEEEYEVVILDELGVVVVFP